ncbi:hypothetical protein ACSBR1_021163 [Camellia fascicularis]
MATPSLLFLLSLLSLLALSSSSPPPTTTTTTTTLSLSPLTKTQFPNPYQTLNHLTSSSISRAHHLKTPHKNSSHTKIKTPLFPHSYGGYSISLSFGTPPQTLSLLMDTGSSLVWVPCTHRYICSNCNFPNQNPSNLSTFLPKSSSSAKILGCGNPKCGWVFGPDIQTQCKGCEAGSSNCTQFCPSYGIQYGSGSTFGLLLSETLIFPDKTVEDFVLGCSILSTRQPSGIAGFGRGPESLPAQMGLKKFSYCLVSHRFDDTPVSSDLVLVSGSDSGAGDVDYTPFVNNSFAGNSAFRDYYYVHLRKITVGGKHVKVPYSFLVPGSDGNGGTIVDSGTTFTFMERKVFEVVAHEFEKQMAQYSKAADVENRTGLRPCYDISGKKPVFFPDLIFHFKGGAKMALPLADYFSFVGRVSVACMTIVTDTSVGPQVGGGPSIILGNYQQQNFYLEYDLQNDKLGFRKQICSK